MKSALLGALIIASIANGMSLLGYSSATQYIVTGVDPARRRHARHGLAPAARRVGPVTRRRSASRCSATPSWARRTRARSRATRQLDAPLEPRARLDLRARPATPRARSRARLGWERGRRRLARAGRRRARRAVRQRRPERAARRADDRRRAGRQARPLREAARRATPTSRTRCGGAAEEAGVVHAVRLQLPLRARPCGAARELVERGRARRDRPLPRALPAVVGLGRADRRRGASTAPQAGTGAIGDLGAHSIDLARYLVGEIDERRRGRAQRSSPAARSTTPTSRPSSSSRARSARSRPPASRPAGRTTTPWRSTARAAPSLSTSSG